MKNERRRRVRKFDVQDEPEPEHTTAAETKWENKVQDMFENKVLEPNMLLRKDIQKEQMGEFLEQEEQIESEHQLPKRPNKQVAFGNQPRKRQRRPVRNSRRANKNQNQNQLEETYNAFLRPQIEQQQEREEDIRVSKEHVIDNESDSIKSSEENEDFYIEAESNNQQMVIVKEVRTLSVHHLLDRLNSLQEKKQAYFKPIEEGTAFYCYFRRVQSGLSEYFQLFSENQKSILYCENQRGCIGCNYYISLTRKMDKNDCNYLGKLRGNMVGTIYNLYDYGVQPNKTLDRSDWRTSLAYIEYENNFLGLNGPRKLKGVIPKAKNMEELEMFKLDEKQLLQDFVGPVIKLKNKAPIWSEEIQSYGLNFGKRVKESSIKNFILTEDSQSENPRDMLIFGKVKDDTFVMEFKHPLSLMQAFGIAMSEFDFKINCQ